MGEDLGTAHVEEWTDEGAANGRDAGQAARPRALEQAHQDRLRLIVGRVARRDAVGAERAGARLEGGVASAPGLCLEALPGRLTAHRHPLEVERHAEALGETPDEIAIRVGFRPQSVMDVGAGDGEAQRLAKLAEDVEQRHGIGAAGDGDVHGLAALEQDVAANGVVDAGGET